MPTFRAEEFPVGRVIVEVMPKPEILDPQGKAVAGALPRLGFGGFVGVREGKRFELEVEGDVTDEVLAEARKTAETLLSNPIIEDVLDVRADDSDVDQPPVAEDAGETPGAESVAAGDAAAADAPHAEAAQ